MINISDRDFNILTRKCYEVALDDAKKAWSAVYQNRSCTQKNLMDVYQSNINLEERSLVLHQYTYIHDQHLHNSLIEAANIVTFERTTTVLTEYYHNNQLFVTPETVRDTCDSYYIRLAGIVYIRLLETIHKNIGILASESHTRLM